jgi:hypothetical protein
LPEARLGRIKRRRCTERRARTRSLLGGASDGSGTSNLQRRLEPGGETEECTSPKRRARMRKHLLSGEVVVTEEILGRLRDGTGCRPACRL